MAEKTTKSVKLLLNAVVHDAGMLCQKPNRNYVLYGPMPAEGFFGGPADDKVFRRHNSKLTKHPSTIFAIFTNRQLVIKRLKKESYNYICLKLTQLA